MGRLKGRAARLARLLRSSVNRSTAAASAAIVGLAASAAHASPPTYQIYNLGLNDAEHTRNDGFQTSALFALNDAGQAAGTSDRYIGASYEGQSAWLFTEGRTVPLGYTTAPFMSASGQQISGVSALNSAGQVAGWSTRYLGTAPYGQDAWLYTAGAIKRIGLTDASHTASDGHQSSTVIALNDALQAIGTSDRFVGSTPSGASSGSAWIYSGGTTTRIGLLDAEHTSSDGLQYSNPIALNSSGHAAGISTGFVPGGTEQSTWYYNGTTTTRIGFTDADHTRADGVRWGSVVGLGSGDQVAGNSLRYSGMAYNGQTAWVHQSGTTTPIGLTGAEFTGMGSFQQNVALLASVGGQVAGQAQRFNGSISLGSAAWIYNGGTTTRVGLTDSEHTSSAGEQNSTVVGLSPGGVVAGYSGQYSGTDFLGTSAWIYDGSTTYEAGLTDSQHTRDDGYQSSGVVVVNDAAQGIGVSARFAGSISLGNSGWFYDNGTHLSTPLVFSLRDDGYANTSPAVLVSNGAVFGSYEQFSGGTSLGNFGFYWSGGDGFHDLGAQVVGGLGAAGWQALQSTSAASSGSATFVAGQGTTTAGQSLAYLLARAGGGGGWINPAGGTWQTGANWSLGSAPSLGDDGVFALPSTYTATLSDNATAHGINVSSGDVTLDLNGHHLSVATTTQVGGLGVKLRVTNGVLSTASLDLAAGAQLDLKQSMIVDYSGASPFASLEAQVLAGRNGGAWNGDGINSSTAAASSGTEAVGIADNSVLKLTSFDGMPVDQSSVLMKLTLAGDANLDGRVDNADLAALAAHWQGTSAVWTSGDFDYNGVVDIHDLLFMAINWGTSVSSASPISGSLPAALALMGLTGTSVPEPLGTAAVVLGLVAASRRQRRRR